MYESEPHGSQIPAIERLTCPPSFWPAAHSGWLRHIVCWWEVLSWYVPSKQALHRLSVFDATKVNFCASLHVSGWVLHAPNR
jgi:hypothetical protein